MNADSSTAVAPAYPEDSGQTQGTGISPWACYQCKKRKVKCDKTTPSCEICLRNKHSCRYPLAAQKPGPKLGSVQKRKIKRSRRRHPKTDILVPQSPKDRSDHSKGEFSDARNAPLHGRPAHEAKPSNLSSWILHHFHEKQAYDDELEESREIYVAKCIPVTSDGTCQNTASHVCAALEISEDELSQLLDLYFSDLPSISLFHRPTFQHRIYHELSPEQSTALLASMFSLSARHIPNDKSNVRKRVLDPSKFYKIASNFVHTELRDYGDEPPPLVLLQTFILTTYYELVSGVRGVAWRSLGAAIRIAYELRLHLIDLPLKLSPTSIDSDSVDVWIAKEERRRAWWTLWELEVFATFIRKCPPGMDLKQHATFLPVDDTCWFNGEKSPSCFFEPDPVLRWKVLKNSGNKSGRAWFIVINSFLSDAHYITNVSASVGFSGEDDSTSDAHHSTSKEKTGQASKLAVLDNCVSCFDMSLPQQFRFRPVRLHSSSFGLNKTEKQREESEKQTIHAMIHLAKIIIFHKDCFHHNYRDAESKDGINAEKSPFLDASNSYSNSLWSRYLLAAENVVGIVRNSPIDHIRYRHPLLVNTFWIIAAIQLVQGRFAKTDSVKTLAKSNFELLCLTLAQHEQYWNTPPVLLYNLKELRRSLDNMRGCETTQPARTFEPSAARHSPEQESAPSVVTMTLFNMGTQLIRPQHGDKNLSNDGSSICTAWEESDPANIADCFQRVSTVADEANFSFDSSVNVNNATLENLHHDSVPDLSLEAISPEIWHSSQLDYVFNDEDILEPSLYPENIF